MTRIEQTFQAPANSGNVVLGRTLPSFLDEACDRTPNPQAFQQWTNTGWQALSNQEFRAAAETFALGLLDLGLGKGDRVALLMHSDVHFCLADMSCLLANLVDVPIDLTQTLEHIIFVLKHSEAKTLIVSNSDLLTQIVPYLCNIPTLKQIIVAEVTPDWSKMRSQLVADHSDTKRQDKLHTIPESTCLLIPKTLDPAHPEQPPTAVPQCIQVFSQTEIQAKGQAHVSANRLQHLRDTLDPQDLATIIYIPETNGQLQGVMLTHENLSANAIAAFSGISDLERGSVERVLSFLPLNHVLARTLLYGHISYGHSIYFSNPNRVMQHLKEVHPTVLATVPLLLEKIYSKILEAGKKLSARSPQPRPNVWGLSFLGTVVQIFQMLQIQLTRFIFNGALNLAKHYELGQSPKGLSFLLLPLADWLVLSKWRAVFGGQLKHLICGGAALSAEIATIFGAAGVTILQGYGLTQASAVVCCNRGAFNRAGTVGVPIAGTEVAIAEDGEVLVRGPSITSGYYKNPVLSQQIINPEGWLHTGDLGHFTNEGFLTITGLKKSLFKLSTGKYIAPEPIEQRLRQSPLVAQAIVIGAERKFCALLIVPNLAALHRDAQAIGIDLPGDAVLQHPYVTALYQSLVDAANCHLPYWGTVKRFRLLNVPFTLENGLLTATHEIHRRRTLQFFAREIDNLYREENPRKAKAAIAFTPGSQNASESFSSLVPAPACPTIAQSLNPRFTT